MTTRPPDGKHLRYGPYNKTISRKYDTLGRDGGFYIGPWETREYDVWYSYDQADGRFNGVGGPGINNLYYGRVVNSDLVGSRLYQWSGYSGPAMATQTYEPNRDAVTGIHNWATSLGYFSTYTYAYDELGRRKSMVNGGSEFSPAELNLWGYNPRSELVSSYRHEGDNPEEPGDEIPAERRLYNYDQIGNRNDSTEGASTVSYYCPTDLNQYKYVGTTLPDCQTVTATHQYDEDGNLTQDGAFSYTWDAENRLKFVQTRVDLEQDPNNPDPDDILSLIHI
ncbi:MAG: hypothetical protein QUV05_11975 [Phycisphaerae bacterium]|nr:hypothetical protein [Phycisphaerae bacterium]